MNSDSIHTTYKWTRRDFPRGRTFYYVIHTNNHTGIPLHITRSPQHKRIPTDDIVSSVESVLARQREPPESTKDDIRRRIASTLQSASLTECNLTKDELHALRGLRSDKDIVILPADKGPVPVVMDKKDYTGKMDSLVMRNRHTNQWSVTPHQHSNED